MLRLTTIQERSLTIDLRFGGSDFAKIFERPIGLLERAANLQWEASKLNMKAVTAFESAVDRLQSKAETGTYELARRPKKRTL